MFRNNIGPKDRVFRAVAGTILVSVYFSAMATSWNGVALFIGLYLLFTAMMSSCAVYAVIGRNTNQDHEAEADAKAEAPAKS